MSRSWWHSFKREIIKTCNTELLLVTEHGLSSAVIDTYYMQFHLLLSLSKHHTFVRYCQTFQTTFPGWMTRPAPTWRPTLPARTVLRHHCSTSAPHRWKPLAVLMMGCSWMWKVMEVIFLFYKCSLNLKQTNKQAKKKKTSLIPHGKFGLVYLGTVTAATRATLPIPTHVCSIFMCPNSGMAVSV